MFGITLCAMGRGDGEATSCRLNVCLCVKGQVARYSFPPLDTALCGYRTAGSGKHKVYFALRQDPRVLHQST